MATRTSCQSNSLGVKVPHLMGKRLRAKHTKSRKDKATAYKAGNGPARHKIAKERAKKALFRKNNPMV